MTLSPLPSRCVTGPYSRGLMAVPVSGPSFDLSGHVALVTGGNGGIGLGMADALAAHGADVAIWGTNPDKNDAAIEQLGRHDVELLSIVCDVGDEDAVVQAIADTIGELGRIDSCFVNAGVGGQAPSFVGMTSDEWRRVLRVNLDGAFFTARGGRTAHGRAFRRRRRGRRLDRVHHVGFGVLRAAAAASTTGRRRPG